MRRGELPSFPPVLQAVSDHANRMAAAMIGFWAGTASGSRNITSDPERRKRIETAFKKFRADVLRKEADELYHKEDVDVTDQMF